MSLDNSNGGVWGGDGALWLIVLFLFAFSGWGNGFNGYGGNAGAADNYVLASDFAQVESKLDSINNGICSLGYDQLAQMNNINQNVSNVGFATQNAITQNTIAGMQNANALQAQLAQCCCDNKQAIAGVNYNMAMQTNTLQNAIQTGFCQTNYNLSNAIRDVTDNANANTKAILDFLTCSKMQDLQRENDALRLSASQQAQSAYIISQLTPATP